MAETSDSGGGGGGGSFSEFSGYTAEELCGMVSGEDLNTQNALTNLYYKLATALADYHDTARRLRPKLEQEYDSPQGAPAFFRTYDKLTKLVGNLSNEVQHNGDAAARATNAMAYVKRSLEGLGPAAPKEVLARFVNYLNEEYHEAYKSTAIPTGEADTVPPGGDTAQHDLSTYVSQPGDPATGGPGGPVPTAGPGAGVPAVTGGAPPAPAPGGARPGVGGPAPGGAPTPGVIGPGTGRGWGGTGTSPSTGGGTSSGKRIRLPGVRSGMPIGGYRPVGGAPGVGAGATPPGGATPGQGAGPGGPGRPGLASPGGHPSAGGVPPAGHGAAPAGRDRPGKRLTNYEKLEPDTFRDTRHRVKPVIGEQRGKPEAFEPTPGAIGGGNKQGEEQRPKLEDFPTAEAPKRFDGHDMSVSFKRSTRGGQ